MSSDKKVLFGAGGEALFALSAIKAADGDVEYIVDNDKAKHGKAWLGRKIISFDEYLSLPDHPELIVSVELKRHRDEITEQIKRSGISNWRIFHKREWKEDYTKERIISYAQTTTLEDVILYHVCHDIEEIFYVDVGAADPYKWSVTKTLYDTRNAHGINIEAQERLWRRLKAERPRDISINMGAGAEAGEMTFYRDTESFDERYKGKEGQSLTIKIDTLTSILDDNLPEGQEITFLKVDVEGFERNVLEGTDFKKYRPWIVVMEATKPNTRDRSHGEWEDILLDNGYHFAYEYGIDRYYTSDEHRELDGRFIPMEEIASIYYIRKADYDLD